MAEQAGVGSGAQGKKAAGRQEETLLRERLGRWDNWRRAPQFPNDLPSGSLLRGMQEVVGGEERKRGGRAM